MFNLKWESDNLLVLSPEGEKGEYFPVFAEELTFLGLNKFFKFPESIEEPLLWGKDNNRYVEYYKDGELIARVRKGALYREHAIDFVKDGLILEPINLKKLCGLNAKYLEDLINEALDYIYMESKRLGRESYAYVVSYSGGKDSQVVLDLVLEVLSPRELFVVWTDTKMELPDTHEMVEWTENYYKKTYPDFKIYKVASPFETAELWEKFGPPSRIKRWCCSVYKIAPQVKFLETIGVDSFYKTILVFEGTRASESLARSCGARTSPREKTFREINIKPIFRWNTFEVFLYHFYKGLKINPLYRKGFRRVGCSVCPFASNWSEYLIQKNYPERAKKFLVILENYAKSVGKTTEEEIKEYVSSGAWKSRAGGMGLESEVDVEIVRDGSTLKAVIKNGRESITEWAKTVGEVANNELRVGSTIIPFEIRKDGNRQYVEFSNVPKTLYKKLESVLYKSAYCLHCTGCEIECPSFAVITFPEVKVNPVKCTHCGNCLEFINKGCYVAGSYEIALGGMNRYHTFGLRKDWLESFLESGKDWFINNDLTPEQRKAMKNYLLDAELLNRKGDLTELFEILRERDRDTVWQVVWINLCINSELFEWYVLNVPWGKRWTKEKLVRLLVEKAGVKERTAMNSVNALADTFEKSPFGEWLTRKEKDKFIKSGTSEIKSWTLGYALYKTKGKKKSVSIDEAFSLSYVWFGIPRERFMEILNSLKERQIIDADTERIYLHDKITPLEVLKLSSSMHRP